MGEERGLLTLRNPAKLPNVCMEGVQVSAAAAPQVVTPTAENAMIKRCTHKSINKNHDLTTFMLKKRGFILRLC